MISTTEVDTNPSQANKINMPSRRSKRSNSARLTTCEEVLPKSRPHSLSSFSPRTTRTGPTRTSWKAVHPTKALPNSKTTNSTTTKTISNITAVTSNNITIKTSSSSTMIRTRITSSRTSNTIRAVLAIRTDSTTTPMDSTRRIIRIIRCSNRRLIRRHRRRHSTTLTSWMEELAKVAT